MEERESTIPGRMMNERTDDTHGALYINLPDHLFDS